LWMKSIIDRTCAAMDETCAYDDRQKTQKRENMTLCMLVTSASQKKQ
jgi:hypothetical protein